MATVPALLALTLLASGNRVLMENLTATDSGTRLRAAYALAHTFDASSESEKTAVKQLLLGGLPLEQREAANGLIARRWESGRIPEDLVDVLWSPRFQNRFTMSAGPGVIIGEEVPKPHPLPVTAREVTFKLAIPVPKFWDPVALLPEDKAFEIIKRTPGADSRTLERWKHRADRSWLRADEETSGRWAVAQMKLAARPKDRPPCLEACMSELLYWAWLGMDMGPALQIRTPPTTELDWWTDLLLRLVRAGGGDDAALSSLLDELPRIQLASARNTLLFHLTNLPPGLEVKPVVRPVVVKLATDPDPDVRFQALLLLATRPELHGLAGAEAAFVAALEEKNPDMRVRAASELWELESLSGDSPARVRAALEKETDPVVQAVLRNTLARAR